MDPRIVGGGVAVNNQEHLSPLMRAKALATKGVEPNFCPFGCTNEDLDQHGYCQHVVGFTQDGKVFEPMEEILFGDEPSGYKRTLGDSHPKGRKPVIRHQPVLKGDVLVKITTCSRVYRKARKAGKAPPKGGTPSLKVKRRGAEHAEEKELAVAA